jgi:hypothetical protein
VQQPYGVGYASYFEADAARSNHVLCNSGHRFGDVAVFHLGWRGGAWPKVGHALSDHVALLADIEPTSVQANKGTAMAHQRTQPERADLFSTELARNDVSPQVSASKYTAYGVSQRHVLPQDLPNAVKYLTDTELDLLIATAVDEVKRRGRLPPKVEPKPPDEVKRTRVDSATGWLTRGQVNAVRAA